jgi:hypothetical protein
MDYKRAYEELREVYLKDKQAADELAELVKDYIDAEIEVSWQMPCDLSDSLFREKRLKYLKAQTPYAKP